MSLVGIFTNEGLTKTIEAQANEGWYIYPTRFSVSATAGDLDPARTTPNTEWYDAPITAKVVESQNIIKLICTIPPGQMPSQTDVKEIYIWAQDQSSNTFLLNIAQPDVDLKYEPSGELKMRLQIQLTNINISGLYQFNYTQAAEVSDHNQDPNAHLINGAYPNDHVTRNGDEYKRADGTTVPVDSSLNKINDQTLSRKLAYLTPNSTADKAINISAGYLQMGDLSRISLSSGSLFSGYGGGTVNFGTGVVVGGGDNFTPIDFSGQASKWSKYSVNLLIDGTISVIPGPDFGASKTDPTDPVMIGIKSTIVSVKDNGSASVGTIENIVEANFFRSPVGGGGASAGGGAGAGISWNDDLGMVPEKITEFDQESFKFTQGDAGNQKLTAIVRVPDSYLGAPIGMYINFHSPENGSNSLLLQSTAYLVRDGVDGLDNVANSHASGNSAIPASIANLVNRELLPLSDLNGQINSLDVSPGDYIKIELIRGSDSSPEDIKFLPNLLDLVFTL